MATNGTNGATNGASHGKLDWHTFRNTINGKQEGTEKTRHSINPATGKPCPEVPLVTRAEVDQAMKAGQAAFESWSQVPWAERVAALRKYADAIEAEKDGFARMLTQEQGKPLQFAEQEVDTALHWARTIAGFTLPEETISEDGKEIVVRYTPLGVTVGIVPWNFPILLAVGKIVPCLLAGNTIIIKPSPFTPGCNLKLAELGQRFFPPGVLQCISGDDNLGPWCTEHPIPAKVSFTGSSFTGRKVMESCSRTLKRVTLELGGKDPAVVLDDVDIEKTAPQIATLAFLNSGQICIALKRIFVAEKIADKFLEAMVNYTKTLKMGPGDQPDVFLGPIQNSMQYEKVKTFFSDIEKQGQKVAVGGKNPEGEGYFITPTIIDRPDENSKLVTEEPFGPIVPFMTFKDDEEAIKKANNTPYGLGASVWSGDIQRANKMARRIQAGNVWVNTHFELDPRVPFGGHKESGIGTEWGVGGLKSYCNSQTLYLKK